ncbi:MAG: hypothetical protein IT209_00375 [Armatimonadetes bacterium]|nr:hypothetical protein [Armatimonadota bacterium]
MLREWQTSPACRLTETEIPAATPDSPCSRRLWYHSLVSNQRYRNSYIDGCSHFVTASVAGFAPLLASDTGRQTVLRSWSHCRGRYGVLIEGFVIMPEHIHVLVRGKAKPVEQFIQYSLQRSARHLREVYVAAARGGDPAAAALVEHIHSLGRVWKERARCVALSRAEDVLGKLEYMHNNPVKRGLVVAPGQWAWSSWANYYGGEPVLEITPALGFDEPVTLAASQVAAGIEASGGRGA